MFRPITNHKLGNLLVYLAKKIQPLYLTKTLKLLYLIDETSVREIGVPVTWLDYQVWKLGPVPKELFIELRHNVKEFYQDKKISLEDYITVEKAINPVKNQFDSYIIKPKVEFDDGEFNDYEIDLIDRIIEENQHLSSAKLVEKLHEKGTLWHKVVITQDLQRIFMLEQNRSNHTIDFTQLLVEDLKTLAYKSAYEALTLEEDLF